MKSLDLFGAEAFRIEENGGPALKLLKSFLHPAILLTLLLFLTFQNTKT